MEKLSLPEFIWRTGITTGEIFSLVLTVVSVFYLIGLRRYKPDLRRRPDGSQELNAFMHHLSAVGLIAASAFFTCQQAYNRYQLRPGVGRYIIGYVSDYGKSKSGRSYFYRYEVAGQTYEGHTNCEHNGCPPRGARYYIHYSPTEPDINRSTAVRVPDTLRHIPPLGWAKLP